jgi:DNA-directed RNA polymerase sigma subunit (sigma70/sigma32)
MTLSERMTLSEFAVLMGIPEDELNVRISKLSLRNQIVIRMLYGLELYGKKFTTEEIWEQFVVARVRVMQIRDLALKQLKGDVPT